MAAISPWAERTCCSTFSLALASSSRLSACHFSSLASYSRFIVSARALAFSARCNSSAAWCRSAMTLSMTSAVSVALFSNSSRARPTRSRVRPRRSAIATALDWPLTPMINR
ncbi:hypothetical protein D3C72_2008830 [compost metagenome]